MNLSRTLAVALSLLLGVCSIGTASAQTTQPKQARAASVLPKAGPGQKVCRHKFPDGTPQAWVCKKEEPCCAWDAIKYVKCGSVTFKCL